MTDSTEILHFGVTASAAADSPVEDALIASAFAAAELAYEDGDGIVPENADEVVEGAAFTIDMVIPTELESGDGRKLLKNSLSTRELPIPLLWQPKTGSGHDGSYVVGRIDSCDVTPEGIKNAHGVFDTGPFGREAERLVRNGMLRGISADLDMFEPVGEEEMASLAEELGEDLSQKMYIKTARTMAATLLPKPAFQECTIRLDEALEETPIVDGIYEVDADFADSEESVVAALIASAIPVEPPKSWFDSPKLKKATPITVEDDGRIYGHIATWVQDHIGNHGVRPPRSKSNYQYFHTGVVRTDSGDDVTVGQLTLAGGHATLDKSKAQAVAHYDETGAAVADVHAGEDAYGIWIAGALRPGVTPEQVRVLRASAPSGDWRPVNNRLELVAICQVNVPGFPVTRACVASGHLTALVAAGAGELYKMKHTAVEDRLSAVESDILRREKDLVVAEMAEIRIAREAELALAVEELRTQFAPDREARRSEYEALMAERDSLRNEFRLTVRPDYDEALHPRNREGKWRKKLVSLRSILGDNDDSGATEELNRAAEAEDNGDFDEAKSAGRAAKVGLNEALNRTTDPDKKQAIEKAVAEVNEAIQSAEGDPNPAGGNESALDAAVKAVIQHFIDELKEKVDPERIVKAQIDRLQRLVDGRDFASPQEIAALMARILMKDLTPGIAQ